MKLPESTEWVLHCTVAMAQLDPGATTSAARLARYYDVPPAYLAKQLQALVRAGVLGATTGPRGGFRLARPIAEITVLDIVEALNGGADPYVCQEIRQRGESAATPAECRNPCFLATTMSQAHEAWRASLAAVSVADVIDQLPPAIPARTRRTLSR